MIKYNDKIKQSEQKVSERPRQSPGEARACTSPRTGAAQANPAPGSPSIWLIDGYNVLHTVLLGGQPRDNIDWWSKKGRDLLRNRVLEFDGMAPKPDGGPGPPEALDPDMPEPEPTPGSVWIVFDGKRPSPESGDSNPRIVFAPSADQWIVARVRKAENPQAFAVVTADHQVGGRCRHGGAQVVAPRDFIARSGPPEP